MNVIQAPEKLVNNDQINIFLAGSIEVDKANRWQDKVIKDLSDEKVTLLNPRRSNWDKSWIQNINNIEFKKQVTWELDALELADIIIMYFDNSTQSPISLLELGLFAKSGRLVVCCPDGFWRKGNVDIVCERYKVPQADSLDELINEVKKKL